MLATDPMSLEVSSLCKCLERLGSEEPLSRAWSPKPSGCASARVYSSVMSKVQIGICTAAVMSASLIMAVPAHADSAGDFLAMLSAKGINVGNTPTDTQFTLAAGVEICELMNFGYTPEVASRQVKYEIPNATPEQSTAFVEAARTSKLCAQIFTPVEAGGY